MDNRDNLIFLSERIPEVAILYVYLERVGFYLSNSEVYTKISTIYLDKAKLLSSDSEKSRFYLEISKVYAERASKPSNLKMPINKELFTDEFQHKYSETIHFCKDAILNYDKGIMDSSLLETIMNNMQEMIVLLTLNTQEDEEEEKIYYKAV